MTSATETVATPAFRAAGFSRLLAWIDTLPMHGWWVFAGLYAGLVAWSHGLLWLTGLLPVGAIHPLFLVSAFYAPYGLASLAYINHAAARALDAFWPATGWPDADRPAWRREFTTSPSGFGLPSFVVALLVAILGFVSVSPAELAPAGAAVEGSNRVILFAAYLPVAVLGYWVVLLAFVHTMRQLRLATRIQRDARKIDPFDRGPVYAFSGLTARTGLAYVVSAYYTLAVNAGFQAGNVAGLIVLAIVFGLGVACFVLPLLGIHGRLVHEKDHLLSEVEARMGRLGDEMYRRVDAGEFDGTKTIGDSIAGVEQLRERIARLPTWPWPSNVFRGFLSALLLPVIVYLVSRLVGGRVGV